MPRRGPRTGDVDTRGDILAAARDAFAERGFHTTTIRAVAAEAEVDPALVMHYFGSKADLFAASIDLPLPVDAIEQMILAEGVEHAGAAIARAFFMVWEEPASRTTLLAVLRNALTNEVAAETLRDVLTEVLLSPVAAHLEGPDPQRRIALCASHLIGIAVMRYVVGFPQLRDPTADELVALVGPRLQSYIDG